MEPIAMDTSTADSDIDTIRYLLSRYLKKPDPSPPLPARNPFTDQLDATALECINYLNQCIHVSSYISVAGLHALDGWK